MTNIFVLSRANLEFDDTSSVLYGAYSSLEAAQQAAKVLKPEELVWRDSRTDGSQGQWWTSQMFEVPLEQHEFCIEQLVLDAPIPPEWF